MKKKIPGWAVLPVIFACVAAALALVNWLTSGQVARQKARLQEAPRRAAMAAASRFEPLALQESRYQLDSLYTALDASGEIVGYVGQTTVSGYGGPVEVTAGVDLNGAITGVSVGGESFAETPGLGDLTREAAFTGQFTGKTPVITLNEGGVDTVAGASTTSRAVVSGVNNVARYIRACSLGLDRETAQTYDGPTVSATRRGFDGDVTVTAGLSEDGRIEYLAIDTPNETDGLGKLVSEPAFTSQFIGKAGPFSFGRDGVEAISGATVTSAAALDAINELTSGTVVPSPTEAPAAVVSHDVSRLLRPRPEPTTVGEAPVKAVSHDITRLLRPRPEPTTVEVVPEAVVSHDVTRLLRPRPTPTTVEAISGAVVSHDVTRLLRPRPEPTTVEAVSGAVVSHDITRLLRPRPTPMTVEAVSGAVVSHDITRLLRLHPEPTMVGEAPAEVARGDIERLLRPRPATEFKRTEEE